LTPAPLTGERIGDGRRVRNHADSTARKMGSSMVSSGRGTTAPFSLPFTAGWPLPAGAGAGGAQSSRTRGISSVMSSAGENPPPSAGGADGLGGPAGPLCATAGSAVAGGQAGGSAGCAGWAGSG